MEDLRIRPIELKHANLFISKMHRHHKPVVGHRFSLSAWVGERLCGVAICGRPVARMTDPLKVLEVTRLCTDGTHNACSLLYGAAARAAKAIGYESIQTFILATESGTSLRAAGWNEVAPSAGGTWNRPSRGGRREDQPMEPKVKWEKRFIAPVRMT